MFITERSQKGALILNLSGSFNINARTDFQDKIKKAEESGTKTLIFNMEDVQFMDSSALGLLNITATEFKKTKTRLAIANPQGTVKAVLEMAHVNRIIPIFSTVESALSG